MLHLELNKIKDNFEKTTHIVSAVGTRQATKTKLSEVKYSVHRGTQMWWCK